MSDIIKLLPDSVANQIAAGEVIQRPASAVKELIENSIDSGATVIKLIIKDAGRTLIQVIDNGCGMSETDARLSFERHATSKIREANDLFSIRTMGFRGEALASIAAVAHVELKTKRVVDETGTLIEIEGSQVVLQEPCGCSNGTNIAIKNLFYNVPARRQFLKSDNVENRHITEEFQRLAIANPDIDFTLIQQDKVTLRLEKAQLKVRLMGIFGNNYGQRLVQVDQQTDLTSISGFIGKPEFAKKVRGEQFFFVNNRYIKSPYLNHAIENAYQELLPEKTMPSYFLFIEIDPSLIDVNVHPTKTEIKFKDEKIIYALMRAAVRQSLGKFNLTPSIDFELDQSINIAPPEANTKINPPTISINSNYNPFHSEQINKENERSNLRNWANLFPESISQKNTKPLENEFSKSETPESHNLFTNTDVSEEEFGSEKLVFQMQARYILTNVKSGLMVIDKQRAMERILFEKYVDCLNNGELSSQIELFPRTIQLNPADSEIIDSLMDHLKLTGFDISSLGPRTFVVNGVPADLEIQDIESWIESFIETFKNIERETKNDTNARIAISLARSTSIKQNKRLQKEEMLSVIDRLFACKAPEISPSGKPIITIVKFADIISKLK